jgi:hypothetical protein
MPSMISDPSSPPEQQQQLARISITTTAKKGRKITIADPLFRCNIGRESPFLISMNP